MIETVWIVGVSGVVGVVVAVVVWLVLKRRKADGSVVKHGVGCKDCVDHGAAVQEAPAEEVEVQVEEAPSATTPTDAGVDVKDGK